MPIVSCWHKMLPNLNYGFVYFKIAFLWNTVRVETVNCKCNNCCSQGRIKRINEVIRLVNVWLLFYFISATDN